MSILENKFEQYLQKEGLQPKTQESLNILKRAYFSGATDFYHTITSTAREAKMANPKDEDKQLAQSNKMLTRLQESINEYWRKEVEKGVKKSLITPQPQQSPLKIVKK